MVTSTSRVGVSYNVIWVVPTTSTLCPAAPRMLTPWGGLIRSPCTSAQALVTRVTAAPVSTIILPLVACTTAVASGSSHLDGAAGPRGATATAMCGCCCWLVEAPTARAEESLPEGVLTCLMARAPGMAEGEVGEAVLA